MIDQHYIGLYHKGKVVSTTVGSLSYRNILNEISGGDEKFIPAGYEHRPDLIANLFFKDPSYWWAVMERNGIFDPFEELNLGDRVVLPNG